MLLRKTALERICGISTRTVLLGAVSCALGNVVVDGLEGTVTALPEPMLLYGRVVPTALAFGVAVWSLPVSLTTGALALSRRQAGRRALGRVDSALEGLLDSVEAELASPGEVLDGLLAEASTASDVSSPLANIRRTVAVLRSTGG